MLTVHFYLRDGETTTNPDKPLVIQIQLEIEGQKRDNAFSSHIKIAKRFWWSHEAKERFPQLDSDGSPIWVNLKYFEARAINKALNERRQVLKDIAESLQIIDDEPITYTAIRERFDAKTGKKKVKPIKLFTDVMEETIKYQKEVKKLEESTLFTYRTRRQNIEAWLKAEKLLRLVVSDVRYKHFMMLESWLVSQVKNGKPVFGQDHRNKHQTFMKQILEFALKKDYISSMPVTKLDLTYSDPKEPCYIEPIYREKIMNCQLPAFERTKDVAVFLMYTGFSYVDFRVLKSSDLKDGCWKKQRRKSSIYSLPPILPEAMRIIEKYGSVEGIPKPDMSDLNKELKYLGDVCGINEQTVGFTLSTSVFRETFASMMENELGYKRSEIKFMMGHTSERQLRNYSEMQPKTMAKMYEKIGA